MRKWWMLLVVGLAPWCAGATVMPAPDALQTALAQADGLHSVAEVRRFYAQRQGQPAWDEGAAAQLVEAVQQAYRHALDPDAYHAKRLEALQAVAATGTLPAPALQAERELRLTDAWLTLGRHLLRGRLEPRKVDPDWELEPRQRDLVLDLERALEQGRPAAALAELAPRDVQYARLQEALARYRGLVAAGDWPPLPAGPSLEPGMRDARVPQLRSRLLFSGELLVADAPEPQHYDAALEEAVRRFQANHGLLVDGIVGPRTLAALNISAAERVAQIGVNLERHRWMPADLGQRRIEVNITDYSLRVLEGDEAVLEAKVVVGRAVRPTPVFSGEVTYMVFNPRWNVPRKIAVEDLLPQLKRDPYALAAQNIRILESWDGDSEIDPGQVDWSQMNRSNFPYRLRQDPGPNNALGRVKFMFPNRHAVYLHDTPSRSLFDRSERTFSSGCIRLSKPIELADYLLGEQRDRADVESLIAAGVERSVGLQRSIPIHLLYWTAWVADDGTVQFRTDIYERDQRLITPQRVL